MKIKMLKSLFIISCLSLTFCINADTSYSQENKPEARKLAGYSYPTFWDAEAQPRIDDACTEAYKDSESKLVIIGYGTLSMVRIETLMIKNYIVNYRGIADNRIIIIEGGKSEKPIVELWIVPKGAPQPTPKSLADNSLISKITYVGGYCYVCEEGPPYDGLLFKVFAEELERNPTAKAYLIYYKDKDFPDNKALGRAKTKLTKEHKINSSRLRVIGGGVNVGYIEFYIVPKGQSFRLPQNQKSVKKNR